MINNTLRHGKTVQIHTAYDCIFLELTMGIASRFRWILYCNSLIFTCIIFVFIYLCAVCVIYVFRDKKTSLEDYFHKKLNPELLAPIAVFLFILFFV